MPPKIQNNESTEYVTRLKKELENVENKNRDFNSKKIIDDNKLKESKKKVVKQLFEMMQNMGVDPNNLESINTFLKQLEEQDPDLLILFEAVFNNITGETPSQENQQTPPIPGGVPTSGVPSTPPIPGVVPTSGVPSTPPITEPQTTSIPPAQ